MLVLTAAEDKAVVPGSAVVGITLADVTGAVTDVAEVVPAAVLSTADVTGVAVVADGVVNDELTAELTGAELPESATVKSMQAS